MTLGLAMVAQFLNLSTQEAEAGGSLRVSLPTPKGESFGNGF